MFVFSPFVLSQVLMLILTVSTGLTTGKTTVNDKIGERRRYREKRGSRQCLMTPGSFFFSFY